MGVHSHYEPIHHLGMVIYDPNSETCRELRHDNTYRGYSAADGSAVSTIPANSKFSTHDTRSVFHNTQPHATFRELLCGFCRIKTDSVIGYLKRRFYWTHGKRYMNVACFTMLDRIGQRFLGNTV